MLKCALHTHAQGDPCEYIAHTGKELIKEAARLGYDFLVITTHRKIIFSKSLQSYAKKKGVIIVPGIEFEINKAHILGINIDSEILKVNSFKKLATYRKSHPESLIIAPHPLFPGKVALGKSFEPNIELFDAVEISFFYTHLFNFNKKACQIAKDNRKPLIASSDCHLLEHLDLAYTLVDSKQKTAKSIIQAIKKGKIRSIHSPINHFKALRIFSRQIFNHLKQKCYNLVK